MTLNEKIAKTDAMIAERQKMIAETENISDQKAFEAQIESLKLLRKWQEEYGWNDV
jgi:hypothetical protein